MKKFLSGVLVGALLTISGTALAANVEKIEAYFRPDFQVSVNGQVQELNNAPVTVNGSMYLPLREVGTILGYNVEWNEQTKTAELNAHFPTQVGGENMSYEVIENYFVNDYVQESAIKIGDTIYISAVTTAVKYDSGARWDGKNKKVIFDNLGFEVTVAESISDQVDAFLLHGRVYIKESLFNALQPVTN